MRLLSRSELPFLFVLAFSLLLSACGSSQIDDGPKTGGANTEILISGGSSSGIVVYVGESMQLVATRKVTENGTPKESTDVTDIAAWGTTDFTKATVSRGVLIGSSKGVVSVFADIDGKRGSARVTIIDAATLQMNPATKTLNVGDEQQFTVQQDGVDVTDAVTWSASSTPAGVADVDLFGLVSAVKEGVATITASLANGTEVSATVTVRAATVAGSFSVMPETASLNVGEAVNLSADYLLGAKHTDVTSAAKYTVVPADIASITAAGKLTGNKAGSAIVTASYTASGKSYTDTVAVTVKSVSSLSELRVSPSTSNLAVGASVQMQALAVETSGAQNIVTKNVVWASLKTSVATVNSAGVVTAKAEGTADITATMGDIVKAASVTVSAAGLRVHVKKPASWAKATVYAWSTDAGGTVTELAGKWPGTDMASEGNSWYTYFFKGVQRNINVIFNDGVASGGNKTADLTRGSEGWFDPETNQWYDHAPNALAVSVDPPGGDFSGDTLQLKFAVSGSGAQAYYSTDATSAVTNGTLIVNGQSVSLPTKTLAVGETLTVHLYAKAGDQFFADDVVFKKLDSDTPTSVKTLGAAYSPASTTFTLWSPDTSDVKLILDDKTYAMAKIPDFDGYTGVYAATVQGDQSLKKYHFTVKGKVARDPYGMMVVPGTDWNVVMDTSATQPDGGWVAAPAFAEREDAIIYEAHVRDLTISDTSGVDAAKRGKFLGLVQAGTTYKGVTTGLDHLKELGITHLQLMPIYDYGTCSAKDASNSDACYNWGYDPENFNVPEERYAVDPTNYVERMRELKNTVNTLHKNGIRVILDVVYNHTWVGGKGGETMFTPITGKYFWGSDLSGTGNAVNARPDMVNRYIRDSLDYWVREYNIDGFRFDLLGIFDYDIVGQWADHLNRTYPARNLMVYGEPWNGYATDNEEPKRVRLGTVGRIADKHVGVFNSKFREALKGENDKPAGAYIFNELGTGNGHVTGIMQGMRGSIRASKGTGSVDTWDPMFANDPEQSINYVSAHDNWALWDKINAWANASAGSEPASYLRRIQKFANAMVFTAQGVAFLHSGEEMLRTKGGDHNSYKSSDAVNKIDWNWKVSNKDVFSYYQGLVKLRRSHPGFRMNSWDEVNSNVKVSNAANAGRPDVVVTQINAAANGDSWKDIIVISASAGNYDYSLPSGNWKVAIEKEMGDAGGRTVSGTYTAEGSAVSVLYR